ncbi:hypothetical protein G7Z17_g10835 [Cylindrodendrum hubeiense]|uniref:DUF155 domain-containing protein n=1 Tax=Cylindrodendrum hubeiense TaxID=595255 RepID=A0A9P5H556_9HYPO|nr:hypothetical protein G7Z17_g10835 [Cylindrodendrum hubeiense]
MASKQRPSVLVTDARERASPRRSLQRQDTGTGPPGTPAPMRFMTVDNVLQYNTQIPSGQPRGPPVPIPRAQSAAASTLGSRRVSTGGLPNAQSRTGKPMPSRTTKISEKLVLLPETDQKDDDVDDEIESEAVLARRLQDQENRPLKDEELDVLRKRGGIRGKSYAERLPKMQRTEKVSRLTAYCTAQAYKVKATAEFLRKKHEAKTKLYDDCLYVIYALPLLNGNDGYRVRSRPILKTPGTGKTVLDLEIERSEQRDHHEGYFEDDAYMSSSPNRAPSVPSRFSDPPVTSEDHDNPFRHDDDVSQLNRLAPDTKNFAEMFVYSYGVVVFWNFTEHQERDILADLTFADADATAEGGLSLLTRPLDQDDYETEEFHFEYSADIKRPRVFNDMITLLPRSDHMIKLTISHAIAQSTRLCFFEERMSETMIDAQDVPKTLALTGELNMTRTEIVRMLGRLFKSRLLTFLMYPTSSGTPSRPSTPLYAAIREYLEIDPRIKVLNERCRVFLDLAEILSDSVASAKMSAITWIIIVLIVVSIMVTVAEVAIRVGVLSKAKASPALLMTAPVIGVAGDQVVPLPPSDLEMLARTLGLEANATVDDVREGIWALQKDSLRDAPFVQASYDGI